MSTQLVLSAVSFSHGPLPLLDGVTLTIDGRTRAGIVGPNGSGKSTLLRLMAGELTPARGTVTRLPLDASISLQRQVVTEDLDHTARGWLARRSGLDDAVAAFDAAVRAVAEEQPGAADTYDRVLSRYLALDPAGFGERVDIALERTGLGSIDAEQTVRMLSGGQRTRLQLAALDLVVADVLLLDEPTNDLDAEGLEYLEHLVARRSGATVVVSHDRAFLEGFVETIFEIETPSGSVSRFDGGYKAWQTLRDERRRHLQEAYSQWSEERARLRQRSDQQRRWATTGRARAKRADEPDKNIRAGRIETSENLAAKASQTDKALERLESRRVEKPWQGWELRLDFATVASAGREVATLAGAVVDRGGFRLGPIDLTLGAGDRVIVRGPNGGGKSTLLDALFGWVQLTSGTGRVGAGAVVGVMRQGRQIFGTGPLLDSFQQLSGLPLTECRSQLAKLGLGVEEVERAAHELSPGEQTRAVLGLFAATGVNTVVLDEPTNHLDLEAIEQLEAALARFDGTVLLVTHDRRLAQDLHATRIWVVEEGQLTDRVAGASGPRG